MIFTHRCMVVLLALPLLLSGCRERQEAQPPADPVGAYVDVINYNHDHDYQFTLYDLTVPNTPAIGGGIVWPMASGGSGGCCIALPATWRPGLKVMLEWEEGNMKAKTISGPFKREMEIPHYTRPGNLYVTFLPHSEVVLVVADSEPGSGDWPGEIKQTPWEYCVSQHGRKECKAALPHITSLDDYRGMCRYYEKEGRSDLCQAALDQCIESYEDREKCTESLWGDRGK